MYNIIRSFLFLFPAEKAHHIALNLLHFVCAIPGMKALTSALFTVKNPKLARTVAGLHFPNPVGLAAGFDKDAKHIDVLDALGFGFIEIGTLTPKPQDGNPQPRLFRVKADKGIINRMGFNNGGVDAAVLRLQKRKSPLIIGGNIGKNKVTPNEQAVQDYEACFHALYDVVDYFVVNVSSPNTPNLRDLQEKEPLTALLKHLMVLNNAKAKVKPIFLKIAPDLTDGQLDDIVDIVKDSGIAGLIATNTTISRDGLRTPPSEIEAIGNGGLSGAPLTQQSTEIIRHLAAKAKGAFPIIAVGGICSAQDALDKLEAGAALVQVYSGFIYEGPSLIKKINHAIAAQS